MYIQRNLLRVLKQLHEPQKRLGNCIEHAQNLCKDAGKLGTPQTRQSPEAVLILLYRCVMIPSKYAGKFTASPQATEEAETLRCMFSQAMSTTI